MIPFSSLNFFVDIALFLINAISYPHQQTTKKKLLITSNITSAKNENKERRKGGALPYQLYDITGGIDYIDMKMVDVTVTLQFGGHKCIFVKIRTTDIVI